MARRYLRGFESDDLMIRKSLPGSALVAYQNSLDDIGSIVGFDEDELSGIKDNIRDTFKGAVLYATNKARINGKVGAYNLSEKLNEVASEYMKNVDIHQEETNLAQSLMVYHFLEGMAQEIPALARKETINLALALRRDLVYCTSKDGSVYVHPPVRLTSFSAQCQDTPEERSEAYDNKARSITHAYEGE